MRIRMCESTEDSGNKYMLYLSLYTRRLANFKYIEKLFEFILMRKTGFISDVQSCGYSVGGGIEELENSFDIPAGPYLEYNDVVVDYSFIIEIKEGMNSKDKQMVKSGSAIADKKSSPSLIKLIDYELEEYGLIPSHLADLYIEEYND